MVHKVKEDTLDPLDHQDLREAPGSLVSKDNWYSGFFGELTYSVFIYA